MGLQVVIGIVTSIIALGTKSHDPLSVQSRHFSLNKAFQACKAGSNELNRTLHGWLSGLRFWFEAGGCFWLGLYELRHNNDESEKCIETKLLKGQQRLRKPNSCQPRTKPCSLPNIRVHENSRPLNPVRPSPVAPVQQRSQTPETPDLSIDSISKP